MRGRQVIELGGVEHCREEISVACDRTATSGFMNISALFDSS